ncbi:MAG: mediator complex subunit [Chrysothrix sp. TS-e1954]|nr:MAG: mediator complex subunit [Chrysothrix sp. TS-e1954]
MESQDFIGDLDPMDDLFNETQTPVVAHRLPSETLWLRKKFEELSVSGCCNKVAWSNFGSIASVVRGGHAIELQGIAFDLEKNEHHLIGPSSLDLSSISVVYPIEHIVWSVSGQDLAVVDSAGQVIIFVLQGTLNRAQARHLSRFPESDVDAGVVGIESLVVNPASLSSSTASRNEEGWTYQSTNAVDSGPRNPIPNKGAFIYVTRNGRVTVVHARSNPSWGKFSTTLGTINHEEHLIRHASFSRQGEDFLMVTHDFSGTLHVYRIRIKWNLAPVEKATAPIDSVMAPALEVIHIAMSASPVTEQAEQSQSAKSNLVHLYMSSPSAAKDAQDHAGVMVLTVFGEDSPYGLEAEERSLTSRGVVWDIREEPNPVHEIFTQLASTKTKPKHTSDNSMLVLGKHSEFTIPGLVTNVWQKINGILLFVMDDGSINMRSLPDLGPLPLQPHVTKLKNPIEAGLKFSAIASGLHMAPSPNGLMAITKADDDALTLTRMGCETDELRPEEVDRVLIGAALSFREAYRQARNNEDVSAVLHSISQHFRPFQILDALSKSISLSLECTGPQGEQKCWALVQGAQGSAALRCLGVQRILDEPNGDFGAVSKMNVIVGTVRNLVSLFRYAQQWQSTRYAPIQDMALVLLENIQWFMDLLMYILDELGWLVRRMRDKEKSPALVQDELQSMNTPVLLLVLGSLPRVFLRYACGHLRQLEAQARDFSGREISERSNFKRIVEKIGRAPITIKRFELLLSEVEHYVNIEYNQRSLSPQDVNAIESDLLFTGIIPEVFSPVLLRLLTSIYEKLLDDPKSDQCKLFFHDTSRLGLTDGHTGRGVEATDKYDCLTKLPLSKQSTWKQCTRCSATTENAPPPATQAGWLHGAHRYCNCGNSWYMAGL